ncbi:hypothetical protein JOC85_003878 [Bacillus mesophilus]|uniref:Uncharacterized protein n=1 Tax=Bacillus mesophilus TaxID=1808955 RepID=A0A6M0QEC5_9BACI|nr:hypothetical protein [Bacillus mesophilus]MBM7663052.1 hypothetical protein [Bacillus mesophilus]NEY73628.1 hypothetical protein [Bacillus mesophilus]
MKKILFILIIIIISLLSGCQLLMMGPSNTQSQHTSPLSPGVTPTRFEPNEVISTDELLQERISGKINQAFPEQEVQVLVDRDRIIVSGVKTEDEPTAKIIREAVGNMSHRRKLVIVTEDVFDMYRRAHE